MKRPITGVAEAAEYLYAILDEFKPATPAIADTIKQARIVLDVAVDLTLKAVRQNVRAGRGTGYEG